MIKKCLIAGFIFLFALAIIVFNLPDEPTGSCEAGECVDGVGRKVWPDGSYYEGSFKSGLFSGQGILVTENSEYSGSWKNGQKNGIGTYTWNGNTYSGNFESDEYSGPGRYRFANGDEYSGQWKGSRKSGYGMYRFRSGSIYYGFWQDDRMNGIGILVKKDGAGIGGVWKDDQICAAGNCQSGKGQLIHANGTTYSGYFSDSKFHGPGEISISGLDLHYSGDFFEGKMHGFGSIRIREVWHYSGDFEQGTPRDLQVASEMEKVIESQNCTDCKIQKINDSSF